ncbi:MAG: glutamate synthase subunit beta [Aeromicrobium sp.]|nr:MAG: glutamate synthase subunit beta [Aeromicrobium sp.]
MADPRGFLKSQREVAQRRPVAERVNDWNEVYPGGIGRALLPIITEQAGRCMDCGIPFCHQGCPLGNLIPEWNNLVRTGEWTDAADRLHATNNFPEFTGRLCPAPCETACVVGIGSDAVTIKNVEVSIAERAWLDGNVEPQKPEWFTGKTVAVVGSGPAGLAAAQQLTRAGHTVAVYERDEEPGGLMRFGIPEFKMEKSILDRRLDQMKAEGTVFRTGVSIGHDVLGKDLVARNDAVVIATGSTIARTLPVPGADADGIHQAMTYLPQANRAAVGRPVEGAIDAAGKHVIIIGGGDTGADCLGTAIRQGAASVTSLEIMPQPGVDRPANQPWPMYPVIKRIASAHEEGGETINQASTLEFLKHEDGRVRALKVADVSFETGAPVAVPGTERELPADLVFLAMGFVGPEQEGFLDQIGVSFDERGNVVRSDDWASDVEGVFVAGDAGRGQSLIVWAIAEGRAAAAAVDRYLMGESRLPSVVKPTDRPISLG